MLKVENAEQAAQVEERIREGWLNVVGNTEFYPGHRNLYLYCETLPKFQDKTVTEHIDERVQAGAETITVLDIGCGQGICLGELVRDYPQVKPIGLTAADYRAEVPTPWQPFVKKIDYRLGDAGLIELMGDVKPDFVISIHAFEYFADPLSVLEQAYDLIANDGIIFVDTAKLYLTTGEADILRSIWQENGIMVNLERWAPPSDIKSLYSLAIQKRVNTKLPLPFRYNFAELGSRTRGYNFEG